VGKNLKVEELKPTTLPAPDPERVTTTLDVPIREEVKRAAAAALARDLKKVARQQPTRER
jgi:hypothetical protein